MTGKRRLAAQLRPIFREYYVEPGRRLGLVGVLLLGFSALGIVAAAIGVDHYLDRPQYNTINHRCLDVACIVRGGVR